MGFANLVKNSIESNPNEPDIGSQLLKPDVDKIVNGSLSDKVAGTINVSLIFIPELEVEKSVVTLAEESHYVKALSREIKPLNKNANSAFGNFVLYDITDGQGGQLLKIGKANADDIMPTTGNIRRIHTSERLAKKSGYPNAVGTVRKDLGKTTTGNATNIEAAEVKKARANGEKLPLNKEKSKKYKN